MRRFETCPKAILVDAAKDTNNEGRPLCAIAGIHSCRNMFHFFHAFFPHKRRWIIN